MMTLALLELLISDSIYVQNSYMIEKRQVSNQAADSALTLSTCSLAQMLSQFAWSQIFMFQERVLFLRRGEVYRQVDDLFKDWIGEGQCQVEGPQAILIRYLQHLKVHRQPNTESQDLVLIMAPGSNQVFFIDSYQCWA